MARAAAPRRGMSTEVLCAIIALAGTAFGAVVGNWDKLTHSTVSARYEGYEPSNDIEKELRIFLEKVGLREQLKTMQDQMLDGMLRQSGSDPAAAASVRALVTRYTPSIESVIDDLLPVWKQHLTLDQVIELNKFYSTPSMQQMIAAQPAVMRDAMPIIMKRFQQSQAEMQGAMQRGELDGNASPNRER